MLRTFRPSATEAGWEGCEVSGWIAPLLLRMFVLNLGVVFGAGVYEHRIVIWRWLGGPVAAGRRWDAEAARRDDPGLRFWAFVSTGPLTLLTLANLFAGFHAAGPARAWWIAASMVALAERLLTFSYFIPTMVGLMRAPDSPEAVARATRWSRLNHVRHLVALAAWLAALEAFARSNF